MNKTVILFAAIGAIALGTTLMLISQVSDNNDAQANNLTGTPADNYSEGDRGKFCGTGDAKSTKYVKEFKIPTPCTQPQAIIVGPQGNVWFVQSNTGNLAKLDPITESFIEYENRLWPKNDKSMVWGIDYSTDGFFWFTDDKHDSLWNFEISTEQYSYLKHPILEDTFPQKLKLSNSKIIVNDFTGRQLIFFDGLHSQNVEAFSIPSNSEDSINAGFTIDSQNNLWYVNWIPDGPGVLGKINQTSLYENIESDGNLQELQLYDLPNEMQTPSGITSDDDGNIWIADSSSSNIYKFDSDALEYSKYSTFEPSISSYGNFTGKVDSVFSNPYWIEKNESGMIVFNEQGANRIGIIDPETESLIEYAIPSKNPHWADCGTLQNCGIAQVFDIAVDGDKIWFSEWAENNIGVIDTSISLPIEVALDSNPITIPRGKSMVLDFTVTSTFQSPIEISTLSANPHPDNFSIIFSKEPWVLEGNSSKNFSYEIFVAPETKIGEYKILIGTTTQDIFVGKFLSVNIQ